MKQEISIIEQRTWLPFHSFFHNSLIWPHDKIYLALKETLLGKGFLVIVHRHLQTSPLPCILYRGKSWIQRKNIDLSPYHVNQRRHHGRTSLCGNVWSKVLILISQTKLFQINLFLNYYHLNVKSNNQKTRQIIPFIWWGHLLNHDAFRCMHGCSVKAGNLPRIVHTY